MLSFSFWSGPPSASPLPRSSKFMVGDWRPMPSEGLGQLDVLPVPAAKGARWKSPRRGCLLKTMQACMCGKTPSPPPRFWAHSQTIHQGVNSPNDFLVRTPLKPTFSESGEVGGLLVFFERKKCFRVPIPWVWWGEVGALLHFM